MNIILTTEETKKNRERDCSFVPFMRMVYCEFLKIAPAWFPFLLMKYFRNLKNAANKEYIL